jgi:Ca-activated chloride channel family protein
MLKNFALYLLLLSAFLRSSTAHAASLHDLAGTIEARVGDRLIQFPTLKTDIVTDIQGDLATVSVTQTFVNPGDRPLHATYLFPLNQNAAVYEMVMEIGAERIRAQIQEVKQAEQTFQKAKSQGKAAALLKEQRPNMFTQQIANLMPGLPIKVMLKYVQTVPKVDGEYELVIPLVVGPRFQAPGADESPALSIAAESPSPLVGEGGGRGGAEPAGAWQLQQLPHYPLVHDLDLPPAIEPGRVSLHINLNGSVPIQAAASRTHQLSFQAKSRQEWGIRLADGRAIDNRDFVLRYRLAGEKVQAGLLAHHDARGGYFSLMLEPPAMPSAADILPREMVFLLDCSGSMNGLPMDASKAFMREALRRLRPTDEFRIIRFSDGATQFSQAPLPATPQNIAAGIRYTDSLQGEGGTMMSTGIRQALSAPVSAGRLRIVTFLTDGYIGNEAEILSMVQALIGEARLYSFGVGTGVNRYLIEELGRVGRGFTRYMDPTEQVEAVAAELTERLQSPLLTDISVDWGELAAAEIYPARIPDLFAGQSVRLQGRYEKPGEYSIVIKGKLQGREARLPLTVRLPANTADGAAVALVWARAAIAEAMYLSTVPRGMPGMTDPPPLEQLKAGVTALGLKFSLVTRWTAFVAVSEKILNAHPEDAVDADVPLPMVEGVSSRAYGQPGAVFTGVSGPEPGQLAGLALIALLLLTWAWWRRRSQPAPADELY